MNFQETIEILEEVPGGPDLLAWFDGLPEFGDAEVVSLHLDREADSYLTLKVAKPGRSALVTIVIDHWIDVSVRGFSKQNVIAALRLRTAEDRSIESWELGVGCAPGKVEIELAPCFGAYGSIRANLKQIRLEPTLG